MNNQYALRYRFFCRSLTSYALLPKLPLRIIAYLLALTIGALIAFTWRPPDGGMDLAQAFNPLILLVVCVALGLLGELTLRLVLWTEVNGRGGKHVVLICFMLAFVLPFVSLIVNTVAPYGGDGHELFAYIVRWHLAYIVAAFLVIVFWLFVFGARPSDLTSSEWSFLHPTQQTITVPKSQQKEFMRWYEDDAFDEVLYDATHADQFTEEAYHEYRMEIAQEYLDAPDNEVARVLESLPHDVFFVVMDPCDPELLISDCNTTIHDGELSYGFNPNEQGNSNLHWISFGKNRALVEFGTNYQGLNRILVTINKLVAPGYQIRQCRKGAPSSSPHFMSLRHNEWRLLEDAYGTAKINRYFKTVDDRYVGLNYLDSWRYQALEFFWLPADQYGGSRWTR